MSERESGKGRARGAPGSRTYGSRTSGSRTVFLSAGETSGDMHGAALARALLRRDPALRLVGLGGPRMAAAGVRLLEGLDRLAVMGVAEVALRLPFFLRLRRRVDAFLVREGVDLLIPIDYPGFNLPLAERAHRREIPVLYFIAPQVWAWRVKRARRLAEACDLVCVVLPFEEEVLARYGARVRFVGHPLLDDEETGEDGGPSTEGARPAIDGTGRESGGAAAPGEGAGRSDVLGLFPGSRKQEVERMLPPFLDAAALVRAHRPDIGVRVARAPDVPEGLYPPPDSDSKLTLAEAPDVRSRATAAITKSGTVTLELALAGVPMVVGYRMNPLTFHLARRLVGLEHISLVNLVAGRRLVPELLQGEMSPNALRNAVLPLLDQAGAARRRMLEGLGEVRERLGEPGCAERVADHALELLERRAREPARRVPRE